MRTAASLDRAVRKEAQVLVKQASGLLDARKRRSPRQDELRSATADTVAALDRGDPRAVRQLLPALDGLIDELAEPAGKSILREYAESISIAIVIALVLRAFVIEAFKIPSSSMYPTLEIGDHIFVSKFIYGVRIPMSDAKIFQVRGPRRGEVAVFLWPCNHEKDFIKRIVALEGDTVEVRCNVLHVNGQPVPAPIVNPNDSFFDRQEYSVVRHREVLGEITYDTFQQSSYEGEFPRLHDSVLDPPSCTGQDDVDPKRPPEVMGKVVRTATADQVKADSCRPQLHYVVPPGHVFGMGDDRWNSNDSRKWGAIPVNNLKGKAVFIWLSLSNEPGTSDFTSKVRWSRMGNFVH